MNQTEPFTAEDLAELDGRLLSRAWSVVSLREIHAGNVDKAVIGLRHDVDDNGWPAALDLARWEAERGYRSTFFILHTAPYFADTLYFRQSLEEIAVLGHEIGFHTNAIAEALRRCQDPHVILAEALALLRAWGHPCRGVVAHGDPLCRQTQPASNRASEVGFVNDEQFVECARPEVGPPTRTLEWDEFRLTLKPLPLETFGFEYEANRLRRALYLSDSGGTWSEPFDRIADIFPSERGQLHILQHSDWWHEAFSPAPVEVAA